MSLLRVSSCWCINGERRLFRNQTAVGNAQGATAQPRPEMGGGGKSGRRSRFSGPALLSAPPQLWVWGRSFPRPRLQAPCSPAQGPGVCVIGVNLCKALSRGSDT